jgi:hypothetical protein
VQTAHISWYLEADRERGSRNLLVWNSLDQIEKLRQLSGARDMWHAGVLSAGAGRQGTSGEVMPILSQASALATTLGEGYKYPSPLVLLFSRHQLDTLELVNARCA